MATIKAYGAASATAPLVPMTIERRKLTPKDVKVEIQYCGICHSDLHYARNEWADVMPTIYPCVPGHEIIGRVVEVGPAVTKFKVGDIVGVAAWSIRTGRARTVVKGSSSTVPDFTLTYGTPDKHGTAPGTLGGYSESIVVDEHFVLRIPRTSTWRRPRRCSVRASRPIRR